MVKTLYRYIHDNAPEIEKTMGEVPIGAIIVFTSDRDKKRILEVDRSTIPAMHHSKVYGFLKQKGQSSPLPAGQYEALRAAFDKSAARLPEVVSSEQ
jgi:hypothetical protein